MKRIATILLILLVAVGAFFVHRVHAYTVNFSFQYVFSANGGADGNDVPCTVALTTNCVDHFEVFTQQPNGLRGNLMASVPLPVPATGTVTVNGTYKQGPPYGSIQLFSIAVAKDGTGARVESSNSPVSSVNIIPAAPTGFTAH